MQKCGLAKKIATTRRFLQKLLRRGIYVLRVVFYLKYLLKRPWKPAP